MAPAPPHQEWAPIAATLKTLQFGTDADKLFEETLEKAFPLATKADDRRAFLKWYTGLEAAATKISEETSVQAPMDTGRYKTALNAVDWTSLDSIDKFYTALYEQGTRIGADPVCLGQDNGFYYYLQPELAFIDAKSNLAGDANAHPYIMQMGAATAAAVPFKYGFCLGTLRYVRESSARQTPLRLTWTPFHVYLDVQSASKDVYIVFQTSILEEKGVKVPSDSNLNVWDYLPSPQNSRPIYQAFKFTTLPELFKQDQSQSFFNQSIGGYGFLTPLTPWVAGKETVIQDLKASTGVGDAGRAGG
ncbi:MAG: hypothetical protein Q9225_004562 [Loekoesia sp. 1 TL-2023]